MKNTIKISIALIGAVLFQTIGWGLAFAATDDQVSAWLQQNPGATDTQIRQAMDQYGVSAEQLSRVSGVSTTDIQSRYSATTSGSASLRNPVGAPSTITAIYGQPTGVDYSGGSGIYTPQGEEISKQQIADFFNSNPTNTDIANYALRVGLNQYQVQNAIAQWRGVSYSTPIWAPAEAATIGGSPGGAGQVGSTYTTPATGAWGSTCSGRGWGGTNWNGGDGYGGYGAGACGGQGGGTTGSTTGSTTGNTSGSTTGNTSGSTTRNTSGSTTGNTSGNTSGSTSGSTSSSSNPYASSFSAANISTLNTWIATKITAKQSTMTSAAYASFLSALDAKIDTMKSTITNQMKLNVLNYIQYELGNTSFLDGLVN